MPEAEQKSNLQLIGDLLPEKEETGVYVFCCVRNEIQRLPFFLEYYRNLGVEGFFFIDNNSSDGTTQLLQGEEDVALYHTKDSYAQSRCGVDWTNTLLHLHGEGHWCLTVDADELLVYPDCESLSLPSLAKYLESRGANALLSFMLDMYADSPIRQAGYQPGSPFLDTCPHFDATGYWTEGSDKTEDLVPTRGGPRHRLFWEGMNREKPTPFLRKIPLVLWSKDFDYEASTHLLAGAKFCEITGSLLHFKLFADFAHRVVEEVKRGEHFAGAFQYSVYADVMRNQPDLSAFHQGSLKYYGSDQLVEHKLIHTSASLEKYAQTGDPGNYFLKKGYASNMNPYIYVSSEEDSTIYQNDVYEYAANLIKKTGATRILDIGCGFALKLDKYIRPLGVDIYGIDVGTSVEYCQNNHKFGNWLEDDIENPQLNLEKKFDVIICADVIEHLLDPDVFFPYCKRLSTSKTRFVISTPERDLRRGKQDQGPPANPSHIREWNGRELRKYLSAKGMKVQEYHIVDLKQGVPTCQLVQTSWRS